MKTRCRDCSNERIEEANLRAQSHRESGGSITSRDIAIPTLATSWQTGSFEAWNEAKQDGLVMLAPGLSLGNLPFAVIATHMSTSTISGAMLVVPNGESEKWVKRTKNILGLDALSVIDLGFSPPKEDGAMVIADLDELRTLDLNSWAQFVSRAVLVLLDADGVTPELGEDLLQLRPKLRLSVSRQPSAVDLLISRPWAPVFGPLVYRLTEDKAVHEGIISRIEYFLEVETLRAQDDDVLDGPEGPWDSTEIPTRNRVVEVGSFLRGKARDVATDVCAQGGIIAIHEGNEVPGAIRTIRMSQLAEITTAPTAWAHADLRTGVRDMLRLAELGAKLAGGPPTIHDVVVLPVPKDLCRLPPTDDMWRAASRQLDRVTISLILSSNPAESLMVEDLETLVGVALALRGLDRDALFALQPIVEEAATAAHEGRTVTPERILEASRSHGGLGGALMLAADGGPAALLRLAHPGFTPHIPDLPSPHIYDAMAHAWRGREFMELAGAAYTGDDVVVVWGSRPNMRFVFPSSLLLELASKYCLKHSLQHHLLASPLGQVKLDTSIARGDRNEAVATLKTWINALDQAEAEERRFLSQMHHVQPERERRRQGYSLPELNVIRQEGNVAILGANYGRFSSTNLSVGSEVELVRPGETHRQTVGNVFRLTGNRIYIETTDGMPPRLEGKYTVNLTFDAKVFEAYRVATTAAHRSISGSGGKDDGPDGLLKALLLGETKKSRGGRSQHLEGARLTETQQEAIDAVLSGGRVRLIHGPPGTGKTHTLTHLASALARANHSVLVTADSNAAVDHLTLGLRRLGSLVLRVGHSANLREEAVEACRVDPTDAPDVVKWAAEHGIIIATTNYGAFRYLDRKGQLSNVVFDYVIHDEAGQSTAPSSLCAVMRGRRLVLAGDPKQLPPTVVSMDAREAGLEVTLFEKVEELTGRDRTHMLETQFRMRDEIVAFSNRRYYEGKLISAPSARDQEKLREWPSLAFQHVTGRENPRRKNGSISNDIEVGGIFLFVDMLRRQLREKGWTMAILTPYQAQREAIRRHIGDIEVCTVDAAQGREWDVVLMTTVRSNPQHRLGFLADERRLNVAVTRAKRHFILIGDERTLRASRAFAELLDMVEKVRRYYPDPSKRPENRRRAYVGGTEAKPDEVADAGKKRRRRRGKRSRDESDVPVAIAAEQPQVEAPAPVEAKPERVANTKPATFDESICIAITAKGSQCTRKAKGNGYCGLHDKSVV